MIINKKKLLLFRFMLTGVLALAAHAVQADVSGTVFRDFNANGTKDTVELGVPGITVNAYDSTGAVVGTVTSATNGTYTLSGVTGDVRIEFTDIPAYLYPGATGAAATASQSSEQFITAGAATTVNYALSYPAEYCNASPRLMTPKFINGAAAGTGQSDVLLSWPLSNTGTATTGLVTNATKGEIGAVWGVAYKRSSKEVFTSTVLKRHVGVKDADGDGTADLGAVYKTDLNSNTSSLFIKIPNAGTIGNDAARGLGTSDSANADSTALGEVMKVGLGDIDISDDEKYLYVTNLNDKKLYQVDIAQKSVTNSYAIPDPCNAAKGVSRPFGLGMYQGNVYVGLVCDASVTGLKADLEAYVEKLNADGSFTQVLQSSLNYTKEAAAQVNSGRAGWYGWSDDYNVISFAYNGARRVVYPQPVLSDINFDKSGNMILGFIDRAGYQSGFQNTAPASMPTTGTAEFITINGGDLLKAALNAGTWTLGLNDFYNDDSPVTDHLESAVGGVCYNSLTDQVFSTMMDPTGNTHSGGTANFNNTSGAKNSAYQLYHQDDGKPDLFGKGSGLGDLEMLCDPAPIEIGNRVWLDTDGNGIQDAGEVGIPDVTVKLLSGATEIASAVTAADGTYYFTNATGTSTTSRIYGITGLQANTAYTVQFPTTVTVSGTDYHLTTATAGGDSLIDSNAPASGDVDIAATDIPLAGANNHSFDVGYTEVTVAPSTPACSTITNTAEITASDETDTDSSNNTASVSIQANCTQPQTDLKLSKTVSPSEVRRGGTATYTLTLTNESDVDATGVKVTDNLPAGVTVASSNPSQGTFAGGVWDVGTLPARAVATLTINVSVD